MTCAARARLRWLALPGLACALLALGVPACRDSSGPSPARDATDDRRVELDLGPADVVASDGGDTAADTGDAAAMCVISITTESGGTTDCAVSARTTLGCDALAQCWCEHVLGEEASAEAIRECTFPLIYPRAMITLADYCAYSGATSDIRSLPSLWDQILGSGAGVEVPFSEPSSTSFSEECDEIAAYTLWGQEPFWNLSLAEAGVSRPDMLPWSVEELDLDGEPLVRLADIAAVTLADGVLRLTTPGAQRLEGRLSALSNDVVGRWFLIHSDRAAMVAGDVVSAAMSSTREGLVIILEETIEAGYAAVTLHQGYPSSGPAELDGMATGSLAAARIWLDRACISSCGCEAGWGCRAGHCAELTAGCSTDDECCLGRCNAGVCEGR